MGQKGMEVKRETVGAEVTTKGERVGKKREPEKTGRVDLERGVTDKGKKGRAVCVSR